MREYFACCVRLRHEERWFVAYVNEVDGVVLDGLVRARILVRDSLRSIQGAGREVGVEVDGQFVRQLRLDLLVEFAKQPSGQRLDADQLLVTWNLTEDLERSLGLKSRFLKARRLNRVYDKLFWAQNLPSVTPEGCHYEPIWRSSELKVLARVAQHCLWRLERELFERAKLPEPAASPP
jgi:hypothetical protein